MPLTAIFGGTFNPLHIGHYEMLRALENDPSIEKIFLMPDKIPPHKVCDKMAEDESRIGMCKIAAEDFLKAELCLIEFEREGKSYTYDTVLELQKRYPDRDFAFVCGGDMLVYFDKWYEHKKLMELMSFIVFRRSDTDKKKFEDCIKRFSDMGMRITVKDEIIPAVSSTEIRKEFNLKKDLMPNRVYKYLAERGEYSD